MQMQAGIEPVEFHRPCSLIDKIFHSTSYSSSAAAGTRKNHQQLRRRVASLVSKYVKIFPSSFGFLVSMFVIESATSYRHCCIPPLANPRSDSTDILMSSPRRRDNYTASVEFQPNAIIYNNSFLLLAATGL